jgi:16S rRNA (adenine1518-N6/adenine1519-N6)-dimethyltransferase
LEDTVLEIGPGRGAMTPLIAQGAGRVICVEIDKQLIPGLESKLSGTGNTTVINADFLDFDITRLGKRLKIFGNIPYYITTPIIERLVACRQSVDTAYLTVQKEFAKRICAAPGTKEYGSFSCYVQYYCQPAILFTISRNSFFPVPKVDSAFVRLRMRKEPAVKVSDEATLFAIIRAAFGQRRKTLRNALGPLVPAGRLEKFFRCRGIDPRVRAEKLSLEDFASLAGECAPT